MSSTTAAAIAVMAITVVATAMAIMAVATAVAIMAAAITAVAMVTPMGATLIPMLILILILIRSATAGVVGN